MLNLKGHAERTRERRLSRFVAATGPGAVIELRTTDFAGPRTPHPFDAPHVRKSAAGYPLVADFSAPPTPDPQAGALSQC